METGTKQPTTPMSPATPLGQIGKSRCLSTEEVKFREEIIPGLLRGIFIPLIKHQ